MQTPEHPATSGPAGVAADAAATGPEHTNARGRKSGARVLREVVETVLIAVLLYVAVRSLVMPYEVDGASMRPNLADHERVLVNRQAYHAFDLGPVLGWLPGVDHDGAWRWTPFGDLDRGDVVVLEPPVAHPEPYIKRVVALPGEHVSFADGRVYVDGVLLDEPYIDGAVTECRPGDVAGADPCDLTVPAGSVYVLGDNRRNSLDSRVFGPVPVSDLDGEAFFSNWPLDRIGPIGRGAAES
jgi:signal peptidase I